ncbi:CobW family GTP-binding protein [Pokkaliibacter sp. CJK22405]|uniref:CobW family GTP-binding protein n=1 Tax=Pokkaliibacter sp. CJK22405 TaxID=3384615 RepID=UPI0039846ECA
MLHDIPTYLITGFLGSGKTTLINHLLSQKPESERWAIMVNEFGEMGVDQAAFSAGEDIAVKELPGGCMCCAMGAAFRTGLAQFLKIAKPDRLIIEPTGLGHPEGIVDVLKSPPYAKVIRLETIICLLDPRNLAREEVLSHPLFQDQLAIADTVVISKCDTAPVDLIELAAESVAQMYPAKAKVLRSTKHDISIASLKLQTPLSDRAPDHITMPAFTPMIASEKPLNRTPALVMTHQTTESQPQEMKRYTSQANGFSYLGWQFPADSVFDFEKLEAWLGELHHAERVKGIVRIGSAWVFFNQLRSELDYFKQAWRQDSRIELISQEKLDTEELTRTLNDCIVTGIIK